MTFLKNGSNLEDCTSDVHVNCRAVLVNESSMSRSLGRILPRHKIYRGFFKLGGNFVTTCGELVQLRGQIRQGQIDANA